MPKKRPEGLLVSVFVVIGVAAFVILFFGLRGKIVGTRTRINVLFQDVSGLRIGDPVYVRGVEMGNVRRIELHGNRVLVVLGTDPGLTIPKDSRLLLKVGSYFAGEKYVKIELGSGDAATFLDTLVGIDESLSFEVMLADLGRNLGNINFDSLGTQLGREGKALIAGIQKDLKGSFSPLFASFDRVAGLTDRVDSLFSLLSERDGTVSKLVNSDELYVEIIATNRELRALIKDIKANPKRYFTVKVF